MKIRHFIALLGLCTAFIFCISSNSSRPAQAKLTASPAAPTFAQLPLHFEPNEGQHAAEIQMTARGSGYRIALRANETVLQLPHTALSWQFIGANSGTWTGRAVQAGQSNYFMGKNPQQWRTNVPHFAEAVREDLWDGITAVYYGTAQQTEYDFIVAPQANPQQIKLLLRGATNVQIDSATGDLVITTPSGELRQHAPIAYQTAADGTRQPVAASYEVKRQKAKGKRQKAEAKSNSALSTQHSALSTQHSALVTFALGDYDPTRTLTIDPVLSYATYLGGSDADYGNSIGLDSAGNIYVAGETFSANFPTVGGVQPTSAGDSDVFVTKLNSSGSAIIYSTFIGGELSDRGDSIAVDAAGNAYVSGRTSSTNFPTTTGAFQSVYRGGDFDGYALKLNAAGNALTYSTFLGGSDNDAAIGIAVDGNGAAYVTGGTASFDFPATTFQGNNSGGTDAFLAKLNAAGSSVVYSTYIGGITTDRGSAVAVDASGNAYVAGLTRSDDFPNINAAQTIIGGQFDAFLIKFNAAGTQATFATFLGGTGDERAFGLALDTAGNAYITGQVNNASFPALNALFPTYRGGAADAFLAKYSATGTRNFATFLGGSSDDRGLAVAVRGANLYVTGFTSSTNFPTVAPLQAANAGRFDAFLAKLDTAGTALSYSTYLGGSEDDNYNGQNITYSGNLAVNATGEAYLVGSTFSTNFPTVNPLRTSNAGQYDAFIAKISDTPAAPSFTLSAAPASRIVAPGVMANYALSLTPASGFTGSVMLGFANPLPNGLSASFSTNPVNITDANAVMSALSIGTTNATPEGTYNLTVTATSGTITSTANVSVTVTRNLSPTLYVASLDGLQEVPATNSPARGVSAISLYADNTAVVTLFFTGLTTAQTAAHIHGPAPIGQNAPVLFNFPLGTFQNFQISLTASQVQNLQAGLLYANVHTTAFTAGEIRGQYAATTPANPLENAQFFVAQQYFDFLNRVADLDGFTYWTSQITSCGTNAACITRRRVEVSAAFFVEQEFQTSGLYVYLTRRATLGTQPTFAQYQADRAAIGIGTPAERLAFLENWVQQPAFLALYPTTLRSIDFVNRLISTTLQATGVDLSNRAEELQREYSSTNSRARVVRLVVEDPRLRVAEYNKAFVLAEYFGYLRRDPDTAGYNYWLNILNANPNNARGMVCAFVSSAEYQQRFSPVVTRTDAPCGSL